MNKKKETQFMNAVKASLRRFFVVILILTAVLFALFDYVIYFGAEFLEKMVLIKNNFQPYFMPISAGIFILFGLLLWLFFYFFFKDLNKLPNQDADNKAHAVPSNKTDKKEKERGADRMFLYLLSVLQREGRLMDFFFEEIDSYEDAQIGAAVRNIHENCKKAIVKNLLPKAIINEKEGEQITIQQNFDSVSIKLTGNVTGEPPFQGVVRHRGWKAGKLDKPVLSSSVHDSKIITPAEVEIL